MIALPALAPRTVAQALLLVWLGLLVIGGPAPAAAALQVRIIQPAPGATVDAATVPIELTVDGAALPVGAMQWTAGGGFHVRLDDQDVVQTRALRFALLAVAPGPHRLRVTLEDDPAGSAAPAEVAFTAQGHSLPTGTTWALAGPVAALAVLLIGGLLVGWLRWVRPQQAEAVYDEPPREP